jgi:transcriptional regulator with XRE-family HTH domain
MGIKAAATATEGESPFGHLIYQHRTRIGLTQRALADFSTISVRAIRDLEQGRARRPRSDTVRLIADGLRLGPRARRDLEMAASQGLTGWALKSAFEGEPPAPPAALGAMVGRDDECDAIEGELRDGAERVVTVAGLDGVGKTRLALEVAGRLRADGELPVLWFALRDGPRDYRADASAARYSELLRGLAAEIFLPAGGQATNDLSPTGSAEDTARFTELLGTRPAVVVVDGVGEQHPDCDRISRLMTDCPGLRLLITGSHPSGLPHERIFLLRPLPTPADSAVCDPATLTDEPAAQVFLDQVRRSRPDYTLTDSDAGLVAEICRQLDGLPRALRAAASWLVVYDMPTLHQCLHDDPATLLEHLAGADGGDRLQDTLGRRVRQLPGQLRVLLDELCDWGEEFTLSDVVDLTGLSLPDSARLVHALVMDGVVLSLYQDGRSRFRVLNVVRASDLMVRGERTADPRFLAR